MSDNTSKGGFRVGFFGLLGLLFIGLKLGGVIGWPWIWVLAPLWIGPVILILIIIAAAVISR
jgi:hypothetical protein